MLLLTGVAPAPWNAATAPAAGADPVVSEHFGTTVTDPYRHLENLDDPHVQARLRQQADDSKATLAEIPGRGQLLARIRDLERAAVVATPPDEPSATIAAARADVPGVTIKTQSWISAGRLNVFDPQTGRLTDARLAPEDREPPEWLAFTETIAKSHDRTRVPLSIIHRADLVRDGNRPALLEGYGAYGFAFPMSFSPHRLAWLERDGVIAVAHARGGGTFGRAWHHAGRRTTKPNTWKDFIACAEYLIAEGYTSTRRLCGHGRSAGGILIGRAVTERPDLFAAAHIGVGCTDMIRFETTENGPPNISEFGAVTEEKGFRGLFAMSTIHQIRDGAAYPAVLLTHGINDPRVAPWQSAKTASRFQEATSSGKPLLLRID